MEPHGLSHPWFSGNRDKLLKEERLIHGKGGKMFFSFFDSIPMQGAKIFILVILAVIAVWIAALPGKYIFKGIDKPKLWQDLRIWVVLLMGVQILIYLIL